jgi:predicted MFS family arabinose efflux permease
MSQTGRVVLALASTQALFQTASVLIMTIGGLAGQLLAPEPSLATLPIAMVALGVAVATIPASTLMARAGRRPGFLVGTMFGAAGGTAAAAGIVSGSFLLLCLGTLLVGFNQGFAQFYRFAAAEAVPLQFRSRALSMVLAGGVVAAFAGPHLGAITRNLLFGAAYAGSFAAVVALSLVAAAILSATPLPPPAAADPDAEPARSLGEIARQPRFVAAITGGTVGYAVMVLVMTATPLSMLAHHHSVSDAAFVIQWHVLAMFVPSFFTGWLVSRFGVTSIMLAGVGLLFGEVAITASGTDMLQFASALILLGTGWNFLYVGGSTMLLETYRPSERGKVQALNDFVIVGVTAGAAFSAGALVESFGWYGMNLAVIPFLVVTAIVIALAGTSRSRRSLGELQL